MTSANFLGFHPGTIQLTQVWWGIFASASFSWLTCLLTHCGRVTHYGDGNMLYKNPIFFIMKEVPQI